MLLRPFCLSVSLSVHNTRGPAQTVQDMETYLHHTIRAMFLDCFLKSNFVILSLGVHPNECVKEEYSVKSAKFDE